MKTAEKYAKCDPILFIIYIQIYVNIYPSINSYKYEEVAEKITSKLLMEATSGNG